MPKQRTSSSMPNSIWLQALIGRPLPRDTAAFLFGFELITAVRPVQPAEEIVAVEVQLGWWPTWKSYEPDSPVVIRPVDPSIWTPPALPLGSQVETPYGRGMLRAYDPINNADAPYIVELWGYWEASADALAGVTADELHLVQARSNGR